MANIHVNRGATSLGIFSEEEVREGLRSGRFVGSDIMWREGMATWQALGTLPEFAAEIPTATPAGSTLPVAPTTVAVTGAAVVRVGLPWDNRHQLGFLKAFFETMKMVLTQPALAFASMKTEGGFGEPLIYAVAGGSVGLIAYLLFMVLMSSLGMMADRNNALAGMMGMGFGLLFLIICAPIMLVMGVFISSGICHLSLMLVGGAKRTFETTFRVICFSFGSAYPLLLVPFCGGMIAGVWNIICQCIGLARAHEIDTGKAVLAVFLPLIVCCGGGFLLAIMFGALGALTGHH